MKQIYWVDVLERQEGTINTAIVKESYPFPDVEFAPFGFDLELFEQQIQKIADDNLRISTQRRFEFIRDIWHPKNFIRLAIRQWKYAK